MRAKKDSNLASIAAICVDWVNEELNKFKDQQKIIAYNQFIRQDLTFIVKNELQHISSPSDTNAGQSVEHMSERISSSLQAKLDSLLESTESKIMALADKYETSNIQLTNANMKDKLIGLLLCLKDLTGKPTRKNKSGDSLSAKMDLNDIAQILRLHFAPYKGLKIDSVNSDHVDPPFWDVDPTREAGNKSKSLKRVKNTKVIDCSSLFFFSGILL